MLSDAQTTLPTNAAPARTKVEFLYREILQESEQLVGRMEVLSQSQAEFQASFQVLPTTIRAAGLEAADLAAERANRALSEACRSVAKAASDLRIATRSATNALPATAWRTGIICAASAFAGAVLGAGVVTLLVRF